MPDAAAQRAGAPGGFGNADRRAGNNCNSGASSQRDRQRPDAASGNGQPVLQDVRITPDIVNNSLLIYADQDNYRIIEATLQQIDQPQLQVAIDATIAEVTLNNS